MSEIVATFKPKSCRDWSYYCRFRGIPGGGWGDYIKGKWSMIGGVCFPFSRDVPNQPSSEEWCYVSRAGALSFLDVYPYSWYATFRSVHWNWRVLCTQRELCGQGYIAYTVTPNDMVVWVMGSGVKHPQLIQTADQAQPKLDRGVFRPGHLPVGRPAAPVLAPPSLEEAVPRDAVQPGVRGHCLPGHEGGPLGAGPPGRFR
jgi:hypothetical protein